MKNIKDIATNIAGIMIAFGGIVVALGQAGIIMPPALSTAGVICATVGAAVISYFTGKNADGSTKTPTQIEKQSN